MTNTFSRKSIPVFSYCKIPNLFVTQVTSGNPGASIHPLKISELCISPCVGLGRDNYFLLPTYYNFVNKRVVSTHLSLFGSHIILFTHISIKCILHKIQNSLELLYVFPKTPTRNQMEINFQYSCYSLKMGFP